MEWLLTIVEVSICKCVPIFICICICTFIFICISGHHQPYLTSVLSNLPLLCYWTPLSTSYRSESLQASKLLETLTHVIEELAAGSTFSSLWNSGTLIAIAFIVLIKENDGAVSGSLVLPPTDLLCLPWDTYHHSLRQLQNRTTSNTGWLFYWFRTKSCKCPKLTTF